MLSLAVFNAHNVSVFNTWSWTVKVHSLPLHSISVVLGWSPLFVLMKKSLIDFSLTPCCDTSEDMLPISLWPNELGTDGCSVVWWSCCSDSFLVQVEAKWKVAFCLSIFLLACCNKAWTPPLATWISLLHYLQMVLHLSLSCVLHHHSSKCPFPSLFFSHSLLNLVFDCAISV